MKVLASIYSSLIIIPFSYSQGIVNNGANINITSSSHIAIVGTNANYLNKNNGVIKSHSDGGTVRLEGNWTNNAANVAFLNDGSTVQMTGGNQTIGGSNSSNFYHLTLLGTGTKTLNIETWVGGISNLTGVLSLGTRPMDLNQNTLVVTNPLGSAITNSTGYIISETNIAINPSIVRWRMATNTGVHVYPFGVAGVQIPFTFNKTTAGSSDVSVSTRSTLGANNQPWAGLSNVAEVTTMASVQLGLADASAETVIDRWWDITTSAPTTGNLVFTYRGIENTTTHDPTGAFAAQHWNGSAWDDQVGFGPGVTSGTGSVSVTGASTFSPWVLSTLSGGALPVVLSEFKAYCESDGNVHLNWTTASETNSKDFIIERSRENNLWEFVGLVPAAGNSSQALHYSYIDYNSLHGESFYRLTQYDLDGNSKVYNPITINCEKIDNLIVVYPNPNNGNFSIEIYSDKIDPNATLEMVDMTGKIVLQQDFKLINGLNQAHLQQQFESGMYFIQVRSNNELLKQAKKISITN
jgi:hypothetical protein